VKYHRELSRMIEVSEPLPQSKPSVLTVHNIFSEGKCIERVEVRYIQEDEVKTYGKYTKRKLFVGSPMGRRYS